MGKNESTYFDLFRTSLITCNLIEVEKIWNLMSKDEKEKMKKEIASLPKDMRRDIHLRLNMLNEHLAVEILGESPMPSKVYLDGRWFSPQEIRDTCLVNVKSVPRFIMAIFSMKEMDKKSLLNDLKKIDLTFYNSVMKSLGRLDTHTREAVQQTQSTEASLQGLRDSKRKTPVTYLCQYVENKAEILALYAEKLREKGLTDEQIIRIVEVESQLLTPEVLENGT